jgi:hypothetical protein
VQLGDWDNMAYREFRNEPIYNPSQVPDMGLTAQALHDAVADKRARATAKAKAAKDKADALDKFNVDIQEGKFTDTREFILGGTKELSDQGVKEIYESGNVSADFRKKKIELASVANQDKIDYQKFNDMIAQAQKVATDDPYTILDVRMKKIQEGAYGNDTKKVDWKTRSQSLAETEKRLGGIDEFNQPKHVADWVNSLEVQERTKKTSTENGGSATTIDNSTTFKSKFFDEKGNPRVTSNDAANYISSDPRVSEFYDDRITKEIARDAEAIKAANPEYYAALVQKAGGEDKIVDHLKINHQDNIRAPKVDFGARKNLAAQEDLKQKFAFSKKTDYKKEVDLTELRMRQKDADDKKKDEPTIGVRTDGEYSVNYTKQDGTVGVGKAYTPVQVAVTDKNKKSISLDTAVDYQDMANGKWHKAGKGDAKAMANIKINVSDMNYVIRNKNSNSHIAAKNVDDLIEKIKRHPKPESLQPDFFVKATATDADDDNGKRKKKNDVVQDKTVGLYYNDIKTQMEAKGGKVDTNSPEFDAKRADLNRINAAIEEAKRNKAKSNTTTKPNGGSNGARKTGGIY